MPAKSEAQRKWAFAVKGEDWAKKHHFDTKGKLPKRAKNNAKAARRRLRKKQSY
jgi:hypothetical protein